MEISDDDINDIRDMIREDLFCSGPSADDLRWFDLVELAKNAVCHLLERPDVVARLRAMLAVVSDAEDAEWREDYEVLDAIWKAKVP